MLVLLVLNMIHFQMYMVMFNPNSEKFKYLEKLDHTHLLSYFQYRKSIILICMEEKIMYQQ